MLTAKQTKRSRPSAPIERLPRELAWTILGYLPESVLGLRKTSRTLRSTVDEYVMSLDSIVDSLTLSEFAYDTKTMITIAITVPNRKMKLLAVRLIQQKELRSLLPKNSVKIKDFISDKTTFELKLKPRNAKAIDELSRCLGTKIDTANISGCENSDKTAAFSSLIRGKQIRKNLGLAMDDFTEEVVNRILDPIGEQLFEEMEVCVCTVTVRNPVELLLRLSTMARYLHIVQHESPLSRVDKGANFLFGVKDAEWSPIFLEMFAGKIDSLKISNYSYSGYLTPKCAEEMKQGLTALDKKVGFFATCCRSMHGGYIIENKSIRASSAWCHREMFSIEHASEESD